MKSLTENRLDNLQHIIFGGEAYPKSLLKKVFKVYGHRAQFYNVYGPTEATCMCSSYKVSSQDFLDPGELCPLGKISNDFDWLIGDMDSHGVGELILQGPQIANGYLNDDRKTSQKFELPSAENEILNGRIIAFVVPESSNLDPNSLNRFLWSLPTYMRPDEVKLLKKLPKTRNGKIDRMHLIESI